MSIPEQSSKFPFKEEICKRFCRWLDIKAGRDIEEALEDLTGDTYFEMRKLISQLLTEVEKMVEEGLYEGYIDGKSLTAEQKKGIKELKEDLKEFIRITVEATWRAILNKQKVGIDKLSLSLKPYVKPDEDINMEPGDK
jgi:hypothetical protein